MDRKRNHNQIRRTSK